MFYQIKKQHQEELDDDILWTIVEHVGEWVGIAPVHKPQDVCYVLPCMLEVPRV